MSSTEHIHSTLDHVYKHLCKWEMRSAADDNPVAALIFFFFLKYISDNQHELDHIWPEIRGFDYLALLYGEKMFQKDIVEHLAWIEQQLAWDHVISGYAEHLDLLKLDKQLQPLLHMIKRLDLSVQDEHDTLFLDAITGWISKQSVQEIRFPDASMPEVNMARCMANLALVEEGMEVYDFASGYGVLLSQVARSHSVTIYAQDIKSTHAAVCAMMLVFAGARNIHITIGDTLHQPMTLRNDTPKQFDRVIAAPPLGLQTSGMEKSTALTQAFALGLGQCNKADLVFIQHALASLKESGQAVLIVPMGGLCRGGREAALRKSMLLNNWVEAVIELPVGIISVTAAKSAILILKKQRTSHEIYMLDISHEFFSQCFEKWGRTGLRMTEQAPEAITRIITQKEILPGFSVMISSAEVIENDAVLSPKAYLDQQNVVEVMDIEDLKKRNAVAFVKLEHLNKRFNEIVKKL